MFYKSPLYDLNSILCISHVKSIRVKNVSSFHENNLKYKNITYCPIILSYTLIVIFTQKMYIKKYGYTLGPNKILNYDLYYVIF